MQRIVFLRKFILIHSYLYYHRDTSLISDILYDYRAQELQSLHEKYGTEHGYEDEQFKDFTGTTSGFHFKYPDWVINKALRLEKTLENTIQWGRDVLLDTDEDDSLTAS